MTLWRSYIYYFSNQDLLLAVSCSFSFVIFRKYPSCCPTRFWTRCCVCVGLSLVSPASLDFMFQKNINLLRSNYWNDRCSLHNDINLIILMKDGARWKVGKTDLLHNIHRITLQALIHVKRIWIILIFRLCYGVK